MQPKDNHKISSFFSVINKNVATTSADIVVKNEPLQENEHLEKKIKLSNASPKKVLKEIQTTPEKKVTKSTPRSISPSKKSTPKKLFDRSPKHLESFNVQAIDDFVKITPSKSNKKVVCSTRVFDITPEKMQSSLLRYLSPSPSPKSQYVPFFSNLLALEDIIVDSFWWLFYIVNFYFVYVVVFYLSIYDFCNIVFVIHSFCNICNS